MHILIICHVYLLRANRQKLKAISEISDVKLSVIVPERWTDYIRDIKGVEYDEDEIYDTYQLPIFFNGQEGKYFYKSFTLLLNKLKPDIILVEQGSYVLSYLQTILYKKIFSPKAKIGFFTWVNIPYKLNPIMTVIEKFNLRNSAFAIPGNRDAMELLIKRGFNRSRLNTQRDKPIKILPQLGLDSELFKKKNSSQLKTKLRLEGFVIGYVGRLHSEKGVHLILKACENISGENFKILLVGRGEEKDKLINLAKELNLSERLHFIDTVSMDDVADYMSCMDIFILPSISHGKWREQFGHVLIEAMACEVPVIGSTCGEIPNVIGDAGLVFTENNPDELYEHIACLLENPEKRIALGKKGRERVLANYTHKRIAEELAGFLKSIS